MYFLIPDVSSFCSDQGHILFERLLYRELVYKAYDHLAPPYIKFVSDRQVIYIVKPPKTALPADEMF